MAPVWGGVIAAGASLLGGILGRPHGSGGTSYPPEYRAILRTISGYLMNKLGTGFNAPADLLKGIPESQLTREAIGKLRSFGATGYQPFLNTLQGIAEGGDNSQVFNAFDRLSEINATDLGRSVNQKFGSAGFIKGSDRFRALSDIVAKTRLGATTAKAEFQLKSDATRASAAQIGLQAVPQLFSMLAQVGMLERSVNVDNLNRRIGLFTKLAVDAPISLIAAARGAAQPLQQGNPVSGSQAFGMALPGAVNTGLNTYMMMQMLKK